MNPGAGTADKFIAEGCNEEHCSCKGEERESIAGTGIYSLRWYIRWVKTDTPAIPVSRSASTNDFGVESFNGHSKPVQGSKDLSVSQPLPRAVDLCGRKGPIERLHPTLNHSRPPLTTVQTRAIAHNNTVVPGSSISILESISGAT